MRPFSSNEVNPFSRPCVGSGYCCKQTPCGYGESLPDSPACRFLEVWEQTDTETARYRCGKFLEISADPNSTFSPAFGAGCCSPMGNTARKQILVELRRK